MFIAMFMTILYISPMITCLDDNRPGFSHGLLHINESEFNLFFSDAMVVLNQIQCCAECLKENDMTYYYALLKRSENLCVCKRDFDWRQISGHSGVHEVKWIEIREG